MPVSRKRKKKSKSAGRSPQPTRTAAPGGGPASPGVVTGLNSLFAHRARIDEQRIRMVAPVATGIVAELLDLGPTMSDADLEDALWARFGPVVHESENTTDRKDFTTGFGPEHLVEALADAAVESVRTALSAPSDWREPWRVLTALLHSVSSPTHERLAELIKELRNTPGGDDLPEVSPGPTPAGPVLWARDGYGSRFAVLARFVTSGGLERWYLWDIDACDHTPATVHSAYYPTSDAGFAEWRAAVGEVAGSALTPADDPALLAELLPQPEGLIRLGGENSEQFAEYHRCRRLAAEVVEALPPADVVEAGEQISSEAAAEFLAWAREHRPGAVPETAEDDDGQIPPQTLASELAQSWCASRSAAIYYTCSPHRLAQVLELLRDYYSDEFASILISLLPAWCQWLTERSGTPAALVERCRPYLTDGHDPLPYSATDLGRYTRVRE